MLETAPAGRDENAATCAPTTEDDLRRAYFAEANDVAARYGVRFDRVMQHLREARAQHEHVTVSATRHIEDLVQAVACRDGSDLAWRDLCESYERALVRSCRQWLDSTDAILFVRRLLADLRTGGGDGMPSLASFDGTCPLRRWLLDRLLGRMSLSGFAFTAGEPPPHHHLDRPSAWRRPG